MPPYDRYVNALPVIPDLAAKVLSMVGEGREFTFADLEATISRDPGLTAKVLKVANSALYARPREVTRLGEAVTLMGFNTIRSLVILVVGSRLLEKDSRMPFYRLFWKESLTAAFWSKELALRTGQDDLAEEAFVAGLLKDIGRAALFAAGPQAYQDLDEACRAADRPVEEAEAEAYGTTHQEVGAAVLDQWNFPRVYCDTAREHDHPHITSPHKRTIVVVSAASALAGLAPTVDPFVPFLGLDKAALTLWAADFAPRLEALPLYRECESLFRG